MNRVWWKNYIALFVASIEHLKILKHHEFLKNINVFSIICCKCKNKDEKIFKEEELIDILRILG